MQTDIKESWRGSVFQHGKLNDRIYLISLAAGDAPDILPYLNTLAGDNGYGKIFAKVPSDCKKVFLDDGFKQEAFVPGFYGGTKDALFMSKFLDPKREHNEDAGRIEDIIRIADSKRGEQKNTEGLKEFTIRKASPADIPEMCRIYKEVFKSYPFPIHDAQYLLQTMRSNVRYYVACNDRNIACVSSSEMDPIAKNTEMTDFATLPKYRGKGLATGLLNFMDIDMKKEGILTAYTIARAVSYGMNISFARNEYIFTGTLLNNTNISGSIESMNVWYKPVIA